MGDAPQSIAFVVQTIMETLSDAVNQLILLVIALQEQNATMPAHIPPAAEAVATAATTLTDIARGLANDEYEDYPDIHDEIIQASNEMDASGVGLIKAVHAINKMSDRKAGWDGLLQACRIISGKTIRILEIVYGAEIKRLLFIAEQTRKMIESTKAELAGSDPDAFAEQIGAMVSKANELAQHIKNSALDEESPLLRQELNKIGDGLVDQSAQLLETANALLASPDDPILRKRFANEVNEVEKQIERAMTPLRDKLQEITQKSDPQDLLPNKPPQLVQSIPKHDKATFGSPSSTPNSAVNSQASNQAPVQHSLLGAVVAENNGIAEVAKAAIRKDPGSVADHANLLGGNTSNLVDNVKDAADRLSNMNDKKGILDAVDELQKHGRDSVLAANDVSRNPANRDARDHLSDALKHTEGSVDKIVDKLASPPESLEIAARKELNALDVLAVASEHEDPTAVVDAITSLVQSQKKLLQAASRVNPNEPRKKQIKDAVSDLEKLLPYQVKLAKELMEDNSPRKKEEHHAATAAMNEALGVILGLDPSKSPAIALSAPLLSPLAQFSSHMDKEKTLGDQLANAAGKGDLQGVELALKDINDTHGPMRSKARNAATKMRDPDQKRKISDALRDLDALIPQQAAVARELAAKPRDRAKKSKLEDINRNIDRDLAAIADAVARGGVEVSPPTDTPTGDLFELLEKEKKEAEDLAKAVNKPSPTALKDVEQAAKSIKGTHPRLLEKAKAAAKSTADPRTQKEVQQALDELARLLPKQEGVAKELIKTPQDKFKKNELDTTTNKVKDALDDIARALGGHPLSQSHAPAKDASTQAKKAKDLGDKLASLAVAGDTPGVERVVQEIKDAYKPIEAKARNTPQHKNSEGSLADLESLFPQQAVAAGELAAKPRDPTKRSALEDINKKIGKDLDDLTNLLEPSAGVDHDLDKLLTLEQEAANLVADTANNPALSQAKAKDGVEQATNDIRGLHHDLAPKAKAAADKTGNPHVQNDVQQYLDNLGDLLPKQEEVAKGISNSKPHDDPQKQSELDVLTNKIEDSLEGIRDALLGAKHPRARLSPAEAAAEAAKNTTKSKVLASQALEAAKRGDLKTAKQALKDLNDVNSTLPRKLRSVVGKHPDPAKQKSGFATLRHVEALVPQLETAIQELAGKHKDGEKAKQAEEVLKQVNKDLDALAAIIDPLAKLSSAQTATPDFAEVQRRAQKQQTLGGKLANAANKGDMPAVELALKDIRDTYEPLSKNTRSAAENLRTPAKKQQALKALSDIHTLIPKQANAAKELTRNPQNPAKQDALGVVTKQVDDLLDDLANIVGDANKTGDPLLDELIQKEKEYVGGAATAAKANSPQEAAQASKDAQDVFPALAAKARSEVGQSPAQKKVQDALNNLSELLPQQEGAVNDMQGNAKHPSKRAALDNISKKIVDELNALGDALAEQQVHKEVHNVKGSLAKLNDAIGANDPLEANAVASSFSDKPAALLTAARKSAQATKDPARKKQILSVIDDAEKSLPMILENVQTALKDAGDSGAKSSTKKALDSIDKLIDEIEKITKASPEVESVASANRAADALAALVEMAAKGDVVGVEKAAEKLLEMKPRLVRTTREAADSLADPNRRRKLFGAIDNVDDAFPAVVAAARELAANPSNTAALDKLVAAQNNAENLLKDITEDSGLEALAEAKKLSDDLDLLDTMVAMEDPEAVVDAMKDIAKRQPRFLVAARAQADSVELEIARQNMQQPLSRLGKMLPELASDAHAVVKSPAGEQPRKKLAKSIAEAKQDVNAATKALKSSPAGSVSPPTKDSDMVAAAAIVNDLVPELQAAVEAARDTPNDEVAQKRLAAVVAKISKPLEATIANSVEGGKITPRQHAASSADDAHDSSAKLLKAMLSGDPAAVAHAARDLSAKHKDFAVKAKAAAVNLKNPDRRQQVDTALNDLNSLIPELEAAAKDAAQNPKDQKAKKKALNIAKVVNDNIKLAKDGLQRPRLAKQANAPDKATRRLNIVLGKGKLGEDPNEAMRRLKFSGRELDELVKDSPIDFLKGRKIGDAIADLEKRLADKNLSQGNAHNRNSIIASDPAFRDSKKAIEDSIDAVKQKKHSNLQGSIIQADVAVKQLASAAQRNDPQRIVASMKGLAAKQNKVIEHAKAASDKAQDKAQRAKINQAVARLEAALPAQVAATKEVVQNPGDESFDKLVDVSTEVEAALADLSEATNPSPLATLAALAKREEAELPRLLSAAKRGDRKATQESIKTIQQFNEILLQKADDEIATDDVATREQLKSASQNLSNVVSSLLPEAALAAASNKESVEDEDRARNLTKEVQDGLFKVVAIAGGSNDVPQDPKSEAQKQVRIILAEMKTKPGSKINPNHLIRASQTLAGLMADLVGKTKIEAYKEKEKGGLNNRAQAALELDSLLSDMETDAKTSASKQRQQSKPSAILLLENVLASLTAAASSAPEQLPPIKTTTTRPPQQPSNSLRTVPVPSNNNNANANANANAPRKPTNLSDSINLVVQDIQSRANDNDPLSLVSRDLAAELQRFAKADQERRRQDMLISGRAISSHILRLTNEIKALAAQCKDIILQDKLIRHAQALRNFSVQLKILAAVKAASTDDSANNAQLATMTQALGNVLTDVSITVTILKKSKKI